MPRVTKPSPGQQYSHALHLFTWNMEGYYHTASGVIVGSTPGTANYYAGPAIGYGTYQDQNVFHPGGNRRCFTRPRYQKGGTAWYTDGSIISDFYST